LKHALFVVKQSPGPKPGLFLSVSWISGVEKAGRNLTKRGGRRIFFDTQTY
jgi:hypothetical protein